MISVMPVLTLPISTIEDKDATDDANCAVDETDDENVTDDETDKYDDDCTLSADGCDDDEKHIFSIEKLVFSYSDQKTWFSKLTYLVFRPKSNFHIKKLDFSMEILGFSKRCDKWLPYVATYFLLVAGHFLLVARLI